MKRAIVLGGLAAAVASAQPAAAQVTVGWDVAGFSHYVWRGLHLSSKPVLQPDAYVTIPLGSASLTAGGWANVELGKYGGNAISESNGLHSPDLTEFDWWGEIAIPVGVATLTAGATGYIYPNPKDAVISGTDTIVSTLTTASNTTEIYGKIALSTPLNPKVSAYYDVDYIKGLYLEGSVSHGIPLGALTLNLGALAGLSEGQEQGTSGASYNFQDKGLTHVDLSASTSFSAGPLSIAPALHFVFANDPLVKKTSDSKRHDTKVWGGVTISWSKAFGGEAEE